MQIGTLVTHHNDQYEGIGIVIDDMRCSHYQRNGEYRMVTVHWLDGMGTGLYWTDELEVLDKNELSS